MKATPGYYSVIQFCPDPSRLEGANVGVLLLCPDHKYLKARFASNNDRIRRFFGKDDVALDGVAIAAGRRAMAAHVARLAEVDPSLKGLEQFIDTRANRLQITPTRSVKVTQPDAVLEDLYRRLVDKRGTGTRARPAMIAELDRALRAPRFEDRVEYDVPVTMPLTGHRFHAPYTFQNGRQNLVKPVAFGRQRDNIVDTASRWAVRGGWLHRHSVDTKHEQRLVVVCHFPPEVDTATQNMSSAVLEDNGVRAVQADGIRAYIEEIHRDARVLSPAVPTAADDGALLFPNAGRLPAKS
jgi:hypothetical protein